jgi:beta-lactam-binding protein with PASTA domain
MNTFSDRFRNLFPHYRDTPEKRFFKITILLIISVVIVMIFAAVITFSFVLKGSDEVLVPNVVDTGSGENDLINAVQKLQEKGLNARIQLKHSSIHGKGIIIEQRPRGGAVVKSGRTVFLTVSEGPVVENVGNYIGKTLSDIKIELQELFSSDAQPLIQIREPVMYVFNALPAETVLEQNPPPGSEVRENEVTYLDLVVSKGPRGEILEVPDLIGKNFQEAMAELVHEEIIFRFISRSAERNEQAGVIVSHDPGAGEELPEGSSLQLTMTEPELTDEELKFGVFQAALPKYPILMRIELAEKTEEETKLLISMKHPGGVISIPYIIQKDSNLILTINGEEWRR